MISAKLSNKPPRSAVALTIVTAETFPQWLKKQSDALAQWSKANGFEGKAGSFLLVPDKDGGLSRVIAGVSKTISLWDIAALPEKLPVGSYVLEGVKGHQDEEKLALGWLLGSYAFTLHKKHEEKTSTLCISNKCDLKKTTSIADAIAETRALISTPAEELGPEEMASAAAKLAKSHGASFSQIVGDDLLKKNYPAIHAVGRASHRKPRLLDIKWGNPKHPLVTLIGKGVCFDTGGLDLKNGSGMYLMRKDMGGAAVALALAALVMHHKLKVRLRVLIPVVDNSINERAFRPSDVITMRNGLTVEVGNTDAEGRLILADALSEGASENPDLMIDFATLGHARGIFGEEMASFATNDDKLAAQFSKAGDETEDYVWRLPLHKGYDTMLKTPFAEVNSCPNAPFAHAMTTLAFLQRFVGTAKTCLHLDFIAWHMSSQPGRPQGGKAMTLRAAFALLEKKYA